MAFQVRTTKAAELQIETAYLWLKKRNPTYADEWFKGLMNAIASLQEKPQRCSLDIFKNKQRWENEKVVIMNKQWSKGSSIAYCT